MSSFLKDAEVSQHPCPVDSTYGGGNWTGAHVEGVTYAQACTLLGNAMILGVHDDAVKAAVNGIQLVKTDSSCPPSANFPTFCSGDGGDPNGCLHSEQARLLARKNASVSNDTLNFLLAQATSNTFTSLSSGLAGRARFAIGQRCGPDAL